MAKKKKQKIKGSCPLCHNDFNSGVKAAYHLGLRDGANRLQQTVNLLAKVNRHLYDEICRLDKTNPVIGDPNHVTITLTITQWERVIKRIRKHNRKDHYSKLLARMVRNRRRNLSQLVDEVSRNGRREQQAKRRRGDNKRH